MPFLGFYASIYLAVVCACWVAVLSTGPRPERIIGMGLMTSSWLITKSLQLGTADYTPFTSFGFQDLAFAIIFFSIAGYYDRSWARRVGVLHVMMLFCHWGYSYYVAGLDGDVSNTAQRWYLHVLAALSYLALLIIALPPVLQRLGWLKRHDVDYVPFVHPRSPGPSFGAGHREANSQNAGSGRRRKKPVKK